MPGRRMLGIVLLTLGILALAYRGFEYTKETHETDIGPIQIRYSEKEYVDIPLWVGVVCVVAGAACIALPGERDLKA